MNISSAIFFMQENLESIFDTNYLDFLARDSGFIQRETGRIEAIDFVQLMTVEILKNPEISLSGLCDILSTLNPLAEMSPQALGQRINSPGAASFLEAVFCECLTQAVVPIFDWTPPQVLTPFRRVLLQDSTTIRLNEKLAQPFRGCGGSGTKSALKLHAVYDYHSHQFTKITFTDGTTSDSEMGEALIKEILPDDLILRDLGYFSIDQLQRINELGAYFLSRLPFSTGIYFSEEQATTAVDLVSYLDNHYSETPVVELNVYLGKKKFPVRLVAYRLPENIVNERRRKAYQAARKKSRQPSKQ